MQDHSVVNPVTVTDGDKMCLVDAETDLGYSLTGRVPDCLCTFYNFRLEVLPFLDGIIFFSINIQLVKIFFDF